MRSSKRMWRGLILSLFAFFVAACGDSNNFDVISGQQGSPVPGGGGGGGQTYVGRYLGAANIEADQTSVLDLNVAANGAATGTLTVSDIVRTQSIDLNPGVYDLTGSVNLTTGAFNLNGAFPGVGPFSITGTLPTGNNQSSYTVTINGQTFNGTIQNASLGVPTAPNSGGGNGGGADIDERLISGGRVRKAISTYGGDFNGSDIIPNSATALTTGVYRNGSEEDNTLTIAITDTAISGADAFANSLVVSIVTHDGEELEVGKTYPLVTNADDAGALLSLTRSNGPNILSGWVSTPGTSTGSAKIVSLTDTEVVLEFEFKNIIPNSEVQGNQATGPFDLEGTLEGKFASLPTP